MSPNPTSLLSLEEVSRRLNIPRETLRYWRRHGDEGPPFFKLGRRLYTTEEDLATWIQSARATSK